MGENELKKTQIDINFCQIMGKNLSVLLMCDKLAIKEVPIQS